MTTSTGLSLGFKEKELGLLYHLLAQETLEQKKL
jgi:hypothetical protein